MAKIFGISNNPVSTIDKALQPFKLPEPSVKYLSKKVLLNAANDDKFVSQATAKSNEFVKQRNGIGRLMPSNKLVK